MATITVTLPAEAVRRLALAASADPTSYHRLELGRMHLTDAHLALIDWASVAHSVRVLDLSGNALTTLPAMMGLLVHLEELIAYKNHLVELPLRLFGGLRKLHTLSLCDNALAALPLDVGRCEALRVVELSSNRFRMVPAQLWMCEKLETLTCADCAQLVPQHQQLLRERAMIAHLRANPCVISSMSLGTLLAQTRSSDVTVTFHCAEGPMSRELHKCVLAREPLFVGATYAATTTLSIGDGRFGAAEWSAVLQFLYNGTAVVSRAQLEALHALLRVHPLHCMAAAVEAEMRAYALADAAHAQAVQEAAAQNAPVPPPRAPERACLDGSAEFATYVADLLHDERLANFEIVCAGGVTRRVHLPLLEVRMAEFVGIMLRGAWRETVEHRVQFPDVDSGVVDSVLEWVYTDRLGLDTECDALAVAAIAAMYGVAALCGDAQLLVCENLDTDNALPLFEASSEATGLDWLRGHTLTFLRSHRFELLESAPFKRLPAELRAQVVK